MEDFESAQIENLQAVEPESAPQTAPESAMPPEPAKEAAPAPELSLKEKIQKKADEIAAKTPVKDAKTGKFQSKTPEKAPEMAPKKDEQAPLVAPLPGQEKPAFAPNFKFKVMDKEHEVPKFLHDAIKTPEQEKELKEIMEKAYGLDVIKPKFHEAREQNKILTQNFDGLLGQVREAQGFYQRGDMDGFFKRLNIPEETVLQWIASKIEYNQLPPEQKQVLDARKNAEERAYQAESLAEQAQSQHEQLLSQQVQMALDAELAKSDVQQVADSFDQRNGAGAFKAEIGRRGHYYWTTENKLVPPAQVVKELMTLLGPIAPSNPTMATPAVAPAQTAQPAVQAPQAAPAKPNVVPNISGRSASVVKPTVRSIDDIKKRAKELSAGQTA